ncbi:MAG TPA: hypothetical protein VMT30_06540 [Candidatus Saccharimonadia bacterium]|nr:hypothetical protein [Candidatus Saccharimonadia bacterium]
MITADLIVIPPLALVVWVAYGSQKHILRPRDKRLAITCVMVALGVWWLTGLGHLDCGRTCSPSVTGDDRLSLVVNLLICLLPIALSYARKRT